jgi:hypothetical protein
MMRVCHVDHARAPRLMKRLRRLFVRVLGFALPCTHCGKGFGRESFEDGKTHKWRGSQPVSLDWSCRIYHERCYGEMAYLPTPELMARRAELRNTK